MTHTTTQAQRMTNPREGVDISVVVPLINEEDNIVEERRLMYVGITRARESLAITQALTRKQYGEKVDTLASRFLEELPLDDLQYIGEGFKKDEEQEDQVAQASIANLKALLD